MRTPSGTRIEVDGVGIHYVERGSGTPVVLIHGNAVSLEDFKADLERTGPFPERCYAEN